MSVGWVVSLSVPHRLSSTPDGPLNPTETALLLHFSGKEFSSSSFTSFGSLIIRVVDVVIIVIVVDVVIMGDIFIIFDMVFSFFRTNRFASCAYRFCSCACGKRFMINFLRMDYIYSLIFH